MKNLAWVAVGVIATWLVTAVCSRIGVSTHLAPDATIIVLVFLAMHRDPSELTIVAAAMGYLVGRQMLAPVGVNETALVACAIATYLAAGHLAGSGPLFYGIASGAAVMFYHVVLYFLLFSVRHTAGFASWPAAVLVPNGVVTFVFAWLSYPGLTRLERRLTAERTDGLTWR